MPSKKKLVLGLLLMLSLVASLVIYDQVQIRDRLRRHLFPVEEVFALAGLESVDEVTYTKKEAGVTWSVHVDSDKIRKNGYQFPFEEEERDWLGRTYLPRETLEGIVGQGLETKGSTVSMVSKTQNLQDLLREKRLIAHAGGTMREPGFLSSYSNSLEAIKQNYSLGHRIFEFDLNLTRDGRLAAVHDWTEAVPTNAEWEGAKTQDSSNIQAQYTTLFWEDILKQMVLNPDMVVVTDTKVADKTQVEIERQYDLLGQAVQKMDPTLAERIIVQLYKPEDYEVVEKQGVFSQYILTLYESEIKEREISKAVKGKEGLLAVTLPTKDKRLTDRLIQQLHDQRLLVLVHTVDGYATFSKVLNRGIDGVYTNNLLPKDLALYNRILDTKKAFDIEVYQK